MNCSGDVAAGDQIDRVGSGAGVINGIGGSGCRSCLQGGAAGNIHGDSVRGINAVGSGRAVGNDLAAHVGDVDGAGINGDGSARGGRGGDGAAYVG